MQDLTHDPQTGGKAHLVVSSMSGGNTVISDHSIAMSAPGSTPIDDFSDVASNTLPLPQPTPGAASPAGDRPETIPLNWPPRLGEHGAQSVTATGYEPQAWQGWHDASGELWKEEP